MKKLFFILALLACTLLSCSKDKDDLDKPDDPKQPETPGTTLSLSTQDLVFEAAGGWKEFTINCSGAWTLTGGNAWCQPGATSGSGKSQVKVMAEASTLTSDRNVNLTVRSGSQSKVLAVTQKGVNALTLAKDKFDVSAEGGDLTVTLQANVECSSTIPSAFQSWIKKAPGTKAMTSQSFRFTVSPNESTDKREGYIVFKGGTLKDTIRIYQSGKKPTEKSQLILSSDSCFISADAQSATVELKTNIDYNIIIPDSVSNWVHYMGSKAIRTDRLIFSFDKNESENDRTAIVIFKEQNGQLSDTLYIRQYVQNILSFSQKKFNLDAAGGTVSVGLQTSLTYDIIIPDSVSAWITRLETRSIHTDELLFGIAENKTSDVRSAVVIVKDRKSTLSDTLCFLQAAKEQEKPIGTFPQTEYRLDFQAASVAVEFTVSVPWQASISYEEENTDWLSLSENNGEAGAVKFTVSASENAEGNPRKAYIDITYGNQKQRLTVIQGINDDMDITDKFDSKFAKVLQEKGYIKDAAHITYGEVNKITELNVYSSQLTSLKGIEYFSELASLRCYKNQLTALDVSKNTKLIFLECNENKIVDLNVNPRLEYLYCQGNQLTTLELSENTELKILYCYSNQLTSLDISNSTSLARFECYDLPGNGSVFPLTAWFDETNMPLGLKKEWTYGDKRIVLQLQKGGSGGEEPEEPYLILTPKKVEVADAGEAIAISVSTNVEYDVAIPTEARTWIAQINGENAEIRFNIVANSTYAPRETKVVVKARDNELSDTLHILQAAKAKPAPYLTLNPKLVNVSASGETIAVSVSTNVEYDVIIPAGAKTWVSQINGENDEIRFNIVANTTSNVREAKIVVKTLDNNLSDELVIKQEGGIPYLTLDQKTVDVLAAGENVVVSINTNVEYDVVISPEEKTWVSQIYSENNELRFNILANDSYDSREAKIEVKARNHELSDILHIVQEAKNIILLSEKQFFVPQGGGEIFVEITSNVEYDIIVSSETRNWIQQIPSTRGLTTNTLGFHVLEYNSSDCRIGEITIKAKDYDLTTTIQIIQGECVYVGNIELRTEQDIIDFSKYTKIKGSLSVCGNEITTLQQLGNRLTEIDGSFTINCRSLRSLKGLGGVTCISGKLDVREGSISSFAGLENLQSIGGNLQILGSGMGILNSSAPFTGLENLTYIGGWFDIQSLSSGHNGLMYMQSFKGLESLRRIGGAFRILNYSPYTCSKLSSFKGLDNLESIGGFQINVIYRSDPAFAAMPELKSFEGLENLVSIEGPFNIEAKGRALEALASFDGLENLKSAESIKINTYTPSSSSSFLYDFCALKNVMLNMEGTYWTSYSGFPSKEQIINGQCYRN